MFCSIHNHTQYSNLHLRDSINRIPEMINKAIEYGFNGLAITDHEIISGHIEALNCGDKIREEHPDFKIILGNEIYLIDESEYKNADKYWHFILLAKDEVGHRQLRELSSQAWERSYMERGQRRTPTFYQDFERIIGENKGHLIASTACVGGRLGTSILRRDSDSINFMINWMVDTFGEGNCFLEMQDSDSDDQQDVNRYIIKLSEFFGIPYIITQDAHYLNKEDLPIFEKFLNSKAESDREVNAFYKYTYMKPEDEIRQILSYLPSDVVDTAINNTQLIYNQIEYYDMRCPIIVPERKLPEFQVRHLLKDWYESCPNIKFYAYSEYPQDRFLLYSIEQGILDKNFDVGKEQADRIEIELYTLKVVSEALNQRMSAYLNLVKEIVDIAWEVTFVGVSRGSAMSFLINYLIGITQANPMLYDIPYWRFMNVESSATIMDIDCDFSNDKAPELMEALRQHYGYDCVLNTLTYKKESLKSAILTACRGLDIPVDEAQPLSAMVPMSRGHVYTLEECENGNEEQGYEPAPELIKALKAYPNLYETVCKIEGLISGAGVHASACYVFSHGYLEHLGMMRAPNGTRITCYDYRAADQVGSLKFDCLYTDAQTKLMKCVELLLKAGEIQWQGSLRATYNKYLHPDVLDYNNPQMWEDMQNGKIANLFQFETQVGAVCIKRTRPTSVAELGAANAVMRLMGEDGEERPLDRYVRFRNNINEWYKEMNEAGLTPEEQQVLKEELLSKYGNSVEQEDMMRLVQRPEIANFTLGEANLLRKAVAKKDAKKIEKMKKRFFEAIDKEESE